MTHLSDLNKNMPILIVDDFSTVRRVVRNCLGRLGFKNVMEAEDGPTAMQLLKSNEVELVISDWHMPNVSGSDLLAAVRKDNNLKTMPFLMIIPEAKRTEVEKKTTATQEEYLVKPFTTEALQAKMEALLVERFDSSFEKI